MRYTFICSELPIFVVLFAIVVPELPTKNPVPLRVTGLLSQRVGVNYIVLTLRKQLPGFPNHTHSVVCKSRNQ
jgi:hypothetical protein